MLEVTYEEVDGVRLNFTRSRDARASVLNGLERIILGIIKDNSTVSADRVFLSTVRGTLPEELHQGNLNFNLVYDDESFDDSQVMH